MTSSNGNIFRVTVPLCGEFTGHRWIPLTKGQWLGVLMFSLICAWTNRWANTPDAGDFETPSRYYGITVMAGTFDIPDCSTLQKTGLFQDTKYSKSHEMKQFGFLRCVSMKNKYRQTSNINHTKSQNVNVSRPVLWLSLSNPMKPGTCATKKFPC